MFAPDPNPTAKGPSPAPSHAHARAEEPDLGTAAMPSRGPLPKLRRQIDIIRFEEGSKEIMNLARELGRLQDRSPDSRQIARLEGQLQSEMRSISDLQQRYPDLKASLEELQAKGFEMGARERSAADRVAVKIYGCLRNLSVQHRIIARHLENRTTEDLRLIERAYADRYGISLKDALNRAFARPIFCPFGRAGTNAALKLSRLRDIIDGDKPGAAADELCLALKHRSLPDALKAIRSAGEGFAEAERVFAQRHAGTFRAGDFEQAVARRFKPRDAQAILALRSGSPALADAAILEKLLLRRRPDIAKATELLNSRSSEDIAAARACLTERHGKNADDFIKSLRIKEGDTRADRLRFLLRGDKYAADVCTIRAGMTKQPGEWVGEAFIGKDAEYRRALIKGYEAFYDRSFWKDLKSSLGRGPDLYLMARLVTKGKLSPAEILRDCMLGIGTDEEGIKKVLHRKSPAEIAEIEKEYTKFRRHNFLDGYIFKPLSLVKSFFGTLLEFGRNGSFSDSFKRKTLTERSLRRDIASELTGEDRRDIEALLKGHPEGPIERFEKLAERHAFERSGKLSGMIDLFTREGRAMDRDLATAREIRESHAAGKASLRDLKRLDMVLDYLEHGLDSFRRTKHSVSYVGANLFSAVTSAVATPISLACYDSIGLAMAVTGIASMLGRVVMKLGLTAGGYGREDLASDAALSAVDGCTLAAGKLVAALGPLGRRLATSPIGKRVVRSMSSFALKSIVRSGQLLEEGKVSKHLAYASKGDEPISADDFDLNDFLRRLSIYT